MFRTLKTDAPTTEHPSGTSVTQTYNVRGQTAERTLARGAKTTYGYDNATGELLSQTYSDGTPAVTYTYGRMGQVETVGDFTGTRDIVYDANKPWRMVAEAQSAFYGNRVVSRLYDETGVVGRVRGFQVGGTAGSSSDLEQTFGFTTVGRFDTITSKRDANASSRRFRYGYRSDSALLESVAIDDGAGPGGHPFTITRDYETQRDLITSLESKWSTTSRTKYVYAHDERGQRTSVVQSGSAFSDYGDSTYRLFAYNGRGEVTGDVGYLGSNVASQSVPLPGRHHEFAYDHAGNRSWSNRTGVSGLRDDYTTNALNQYVTRENNTVAVSGTAEPDTGGAGGTAVAVAGGSAAPVAAGRQGRYWNDEISLANTLHAWRGPLTIFTAKRGTGGSPDLYRLDTRMVETAAVLQTFTYDDDGNLTSDGLVDYTWDAENRLIRMETTEGILAFGFPHRVIEFRYDYMGRRVQKRVLDLDQSPAVEISCRRFLYDGWNVVAEFNAPGGSTIGTLVRSYTWGLDIALSMSNAGGVGALLQIADHASGKTFLPTYDGNGNIASLVNADTGAVAAAYEYSPFGEPLRAQTADATVADNPFRFSTKWTDLETGLVYYGHRYYTPRNGRFINRDPIAESGGLNLYGFCLNNPVNRWDYLGMTGHPVPSSSSLTFSGDRNAPVYGPFFAIKPEDEVTPALAPPTVGNPTPEPSNDTSGYGGHGEGDIDAWIDGMDAAFGAWADQEEANRAAAAAELQATLAAIGAGAQPAIAALFSQAASAASNLIVDSMNAGFDAVSSGATGGLAASALAGAKLNDYGTISVVLPPTGSVIIGDIQTISFFDSPVATAMTQNPAGNSSTATGAAVAPATTSGGSPKPNANDTFLGRANLFVAQVGGQALTNTVNDLAPIAVASLSNMRMKGGVDQGKGVGGSVTFTRDLNGGEATIDGFVGSANLAYAGVEGTVPLMKGRSDVNMSGTLARGVAVGISVDLQMSVFRGKLLGSDFNIPYPSAVTGANFFLGGGIGREVKITPTPAANLVKVKVDNDNNWTSQTIFSRGPGPG